MRPRWNKFGIMPQCWNHIAQLWKAVLSTLCNVDSTLLQRRTPTLYRRCTTLKIRRQNICGKENYHLKKDSKLNKRLHLIEIIFTEERFPQPNKCSSGSLNLISVHRDKCSSGSHMITYQGDRKRARKKSLGYVCVILSS